jgi:formate hydrogenlyase transcriptional activator
MPPLREREEDIAPIALAHLDRLRTTTGRGPWVLTAAAERALVRHEWPGNVRELLNAIERAVIVRPRGELSAADLGLVTQPDRASRKRPARSTTPDEGLPTFREQERAFLERALEAAGGQVSGPDGAAARLDLKPTTLWSKLKKHGIDRQAFARSGSSRQR